jgi:hypothetical protein
VGEGDLTGVVGCDARRGETGKADQRRGVLPRVGQSPLGVARPQIVMMVRCAWGSPVMGGGEMDVEE